MLACDLSEHYRGLVQGMEREIGKVISGQEQMIRAILCTLLADTDKISPAGRSLPIPGPAPLPWLSVAVKSS